jgi:hypothetical protein
MGEECRAFLIQAVSLLVDPVLGRVRRKRILPDMLMDEYCMRVSSNDKFPIEYCNCWSYSP